MKSQIDYLRLASWGHEPYVQVLASIMSTWPGKWERGKWLQYAGWRKEQFFIGMGEQHKKRHAVMQASGTLSQKIFGSLSDFDGWYCTRIDLQRTIVRPEWVELSELFKVLGKKGTSLISSEENDTLYLGARTSELFTRLYEKALNEMYLRLEFELKGNRALMAYQALYDNEDCDRIYEYYLDRCRIPKRYIELFANCDHEATHLAMTKERTHESLKKLKWITSLDASFRAALADHEIGESVRSLVRSWSLLADEIDIKGDNR